MVAKKSPLCLRLISESGNYEPVATTAVFGSNGTCPLALEPGTYRFEVLAVEQAKNQIVAIRGGPFEVGPSRTSADLPEADKMSIRLFVDGASLGLTEVAIRSIGPLGEARWRRPNATSVTTPTLYVTADQPAQVCLIGTSERVTAALWKRLRPAPEVDVRLNSADLRVVETRTHPASPPIVSGKGRMVFPDCAVEFPIRSGHRFVTNRESARFGYELAARNGRKLVVVPAPTALARHTSLEIGGPLEPRPWAVAIWKDDNQSYARWAGALVDAAGREVNLAESKIGHRSSLRTHDGQRVPEDALSKEHIKLLGQATESLVCDIAWSWERDQSFRGPPEGLMKLESPRFTLRAPRVWEEKGRNYLAQLEGTHEAWRKATGRGGPRKTDIRWRLNTHNASAQVGGEWTYMSMPFHGLRSAEDPFGNPWFMTHEAGHTFGYHHGQEMDDAVRRADQLNDRRRWARVDEFSE